MSLLVKVKEVTAPVITIFSVIYKQKHTILHDKTSFLRFKPRNSSTIASEILMPEADTSAPPPPPVIIYIRRNCSSGQFLDSSRLPTNVEDTTIIGVAKRFIQALLSASLKPDNFLARLGNLRGEEVAVSHDGVTYNIKLPALNKAGDLTNVFTAVSSMLGCCSLMFGLEPKAETCTCEQPQTSPPAKRKAPAELEAATSTTPADPTPLQESPGNQLTKTPTNEWSIEDVIQFIEATDPGLAVHADLFRKHEIDGKALLLLNSDMMMKYMGLKLGPALKICNLVTRLKGRRHMLH